VRVCAFAGVIGADCFGSFAFAGKHPPSEAARGACPPCTCERETSAEGNLSSPVDARRQRETRQTPAGSGNRFRPVTNRSRAKSCPFKPRALAHRPPLGHAPCVQPEGSDMPGFTYRIVPAPERARKIKGVKSPEARFATTLEDDLNALGEDGWEFVRTETFPVEERSGFTGKKTVERRVMVFRKSLAEPVAAEPAAPLHPAGEPEPRAPDTPPEEQRGPRILGRPVPPVTRLRRENESRSEGE